MIARTLLLLLLSIPAFSQNKIDNKAIYHFSYIKVGTLHQISSCGRYYVKLYLGKRRIVLHCDAVSLDLKVTRRRKTWRAVDKDGNYYTIFGMEYDSKTGMLFVPDDQLKEAVVIIDHEFLCDEVRR